PIYTRESSISLITSASAGTSNVTYTVNHATVAVTDASQATEYYHGDQIGSSRLMTSGGGWPVWQGTFLPYGEEYNAQIGTNHYKFTGKERDDESGLDFFGARYYGSALGRFVTPDPLLNSGRPDDPPSWNRYSYVRNNPLARIDPTGLYDYSQTCKDDSCKDKRDRFEKGIAKAREFANSLSKDDPKRKALEKALNAMGTAGDHNGVKVTFGQTPSSGLMEAVGRTVFVDLERIDKGIEQLKKDGWEIDPTVEVAAGVVHEGTHEAQPKLSIRNPLFWQLDHEQEAEAYRASSYIGELGKQYSLQGVWNPTWAEADRETKRSAEINAAATRSVDATKKELQDQEKKHK
ncbi:MAG TPA: RHS repeat-associated core domain-containing protein, partial [Candidatus Angelobacter sp.]|nr:RHS repeat-associated core domain-containing protein [Candidatus Angelobacter sp.]